MTTYYERLKDPRWQRRRLEILNRSNFSCENCCATDKTLHVHHKLYRKGAMPWDYADDELTSICEDCHSVIHVWKSLLDETIGKMCPGTLEMLAGVAEAMLLMDGTTTTEKWPLRSYEHAYGFFLYLRGVHGTDIDKILESYREISTDVGAALYSEAMSNRRDETVKSVQ